MGPDEMALNLDGTQRDREQSVNTSSIGFNSAL
jgi:hypothetical protein